MKFISVDVVADVDFSDIAAKIADDCDEADVLEELARQNKRIARESGDTDETRFALDAAERLFALAKWFRENQP